MFIIFVTGHCQKNDYEDQHWAPYTADRSMDCCTNPRKTRFYLFTHFKLFIVYLKSFSSCLGNEISKILAFCIFIIHFFFTNVYTFTLISMNAYYILFCYLKYWSAICIVHFALRKCTEAKVMDICTNQFKKFKNYHEKCYIYIYF